MPCSVSQYPSRGQPSPMQGEKTGSITWGEWRGHTRQEELLQTSAPTPTTCTLCHFVSVQLLFDWILSHPFFLHKVQNTKLSNKHGENPILNFGFLKSPNQDSGIDKKLAGEFLTNGDRILTKLLILASAWHAPTWVPIWVHTHTHTHRYHDTTWKKLWVTGEMGWCAVLV